MNSISDEFHSTEPRRGCGHRKIGGLYLVSKRLFSSPCGKLPFPLGRCSQCGEGLFKMALRVPKFIEATVLAPFTEDKECSEKHCDSCPVNRLDDLGKIILWGVGENNYTPESFIKEANEIGISKRLGRIPMEFADEDLDVSNFMCFLVHPKACEVEGDPEMYGHGERDIEAMVDNLFDGEIKKVSKVPGVFMVFRPEKLERVVDSEYIEKHKEAIEKEKEKGIKIIEIPLGGFDDEENVEEE